MEQPWKNVVYRRYNTLFGVSVDQKTWYQAYVPYGRLIITRCFPKDPNVAILDVGCGTGGFLKVFADAGYVNCTGVDISEESVQLANEFGLHQVVQEDMFKYLKDVQSESKDVILFLDVLEHFAKEEILTLLNEARRVLKSEGRIVIHVPNGEGIFGSRIRYADYTHETAFTSKSVSQVLAFSGFEMRDCYEDRPIAHGPVSFIRRCLWMLFTIPFRVLYAVETGSFDVKLSQNILAVGIKTGSA